MFVTATIVTEFWKGASAIRAKNGVGLIPAAIELTHRNTRRYGGYLVHMGIVFMFIGYTGAAFNQDVTKEVAPGGSFASGALQSARREHRVGRERHLRLAEAGGGRLAQWNIAWARSIPERRLYKASQQPTSEVSIRRRLNEDFYINFAGLSADNQRAVIQAYVFPLVSWIWIGFWVLAFGTIVCLIPNKVRLSYARTQVIGVAEKHATVEK